ncbi:hypothetical protein MHU86_14966 [Fragilaria crotonensis]|nr:hypothetical protein MHU86_14966 [Fragilaria crotonensis]
MLSSKRTRPSVSLVQRLEAEDDDDSDIEISTKPKSYNTAEFNLLDDDSSDDDQVAILPTRILEQHSSLESIRKARMARESLQRAQTYHAEDIPETDEGVILDFDLPDRNLGSKLSVNIQYLNRFKKHLLQIGTTAKGIGSLACSIGSWQGSGVSVAEHPPSERAGSDQDSCVAPNFQWRHLGPSGYRINFPKSRCQSDSQITNHPVRQIDIGR